MGWEWPSPRFLPSLESLSMVGADGGGSAVSSPPDTDLAVDVASAATGVKGRAALILFGGQQKTKPKKLNDVWIFENSRWTCKQNCVK